MPKIHHVIYITGLGDQKSLYQPQLISRWEKNGLTPHYSAVGWADGEAFAPKLDRLCTLVDDLSAKGDLVSLVGISAGAGAALNVYMERAQKITGVVFICGKLIGVDNVNPRYFEENPAFRASLELTQLNIAKLTDADKAKMLSLSPIYDNVVPVSVQVLAGVSRRTIPSLLHVPSILLSITLYKRLWINFLNRQAGVK